VTRKLRATRREEGAGEEGAALVLVLLLISALIGSAYAFGRTSLLDIRTARQRIDRTRAQVLAQSGVAIATRALIEDLSSPDPLAQTIESPRDPWRLIGAEPIEIEGVGTLTLEVEDAGGRIPINAIIGEEAGQGLQENERRQFLERALVIVIDNIPGRREEKRYDPQEIADGILDWIDSDDQTRLGDSEEEFYRQRGREVEIPNRPIFSLSELANVPGMDGRLLSAMDAYFSPSVKTPRFEGSGLNPNTAPPHVLSLVYILGSGTFLERDEIFRVLKARQDGQIFCPSEGSEKECTDFATTVNQAGETLFPPITFESSVFMVRSRAQVGDATACVTTVLDRSDPEEIKPLAYRLDC